MKSFIFLTDEGLTKDPNGTDVENLQVLGTAKGEDVEEAMKKLLEECNYLLDSKYENVIAMELVSEEQALLSLKD